MGYITISTGDRRSSEPSNRIFQGAKGISFPASFREAEMSSFHDDVSHGTSCRVAWKRNSFFCWNCPWPAGAVSGEPDLFLVPPIGSRSEEKCKNSVWQHPKLTVSHLKMDGWWWLEFWFPFWGKRPIFRGELSVLGSVNHKKIMESYYSRTHMFSNKYLQDLP